MWDINIPHYKCIIRFASFDFTGCHENLKNITPSISLNRGCHDLRYMLCRLEKHWNGNMDLWPNLKVSTLSNLRVCNFTMLIEQ